MKRCYRYFGPFPEAQARFLNQMARKGFRLTDTGKLRYDFAPCPPGAYQYTVDFVAHLGWAERQDYRNFLEGLGYRVFDKNANLNWSLLKVRWRPYGKGAGQLSTHPGTFNRELLLVEKENDGTPFQLHTTNADRAAYYKPMRWAWALIALLFGAGAAVHLLQAGGWADAAVFAALALLCAIPALAYQKKISFYTRQGELEE